MRRVVVTGLGTVNPIAHSVPEFWQGLLAGRWCLDQDESLSPGQAREITRVCAAYPHLTDDDFVREHRDRWLDR